MDLLLNALPLLLLNPNKYPSLNTVCTILQMRTWAVWNGIIFQEFQYKHVAESGLEIAWLKLLKLLYSSAFWPLVLGRKVMTNLDSWLKSRDITLPTKVRLVKLRFLFLFFFFPVVMYGCKSWAIKKAECWKIDVFELWCWRRLLRVPWTARRSNQSILKEISPEYSLEGLMPKLKLQYFGHLMWRADSFEKTLMLGKIEGRRKRGWQRMRWLDGIVD